MGKMMKRMALLGVLCSLFLTGCMGGIETETRNDILKCLTREGYIGKKDSLEYDETIMWNNGAFPHVNYYDYIYSDEDGELYNVRIDSNTSEDEPYSIKIFYDVEIEEYVEKNDSGEYPHVTMTDYVYEEELKVERRSWFIFSWLAVMED